jgi:phosphonate degradation associated HDIG domain protein
MQTTTDARVEDEVLRLFAKGGDSQYGGESVSQLEHGLQAALLAEQEGAPDELVVAALLHDIGHLLHDLPDDAPDNGVDDLHENLGAAWIKGRFPLSVLEPVRLHVASKRYLCAVEPGYLEALSEPSRVSLQLQGGPMSAEECEAFREGEFFESAIRLRRWDDEAKIAGLETPPLSYFLRHIEAVATTAETMTAEAK